MEGCGGVDEGEGGVEAVKRRGVRERQSRFLGVFEACSLHPRFRMVLRRGRVRGVEVARVGYRAILALL